MRMRALLCGVLLLAAVPARAEFWLGLIDMNGMAGFNFEWAGSAGSGWLAVGSYQGNTGFEFDNTTGSAGWRWYNEGKFDQSGYFGGVILGDLDGAANYNRFGAGGELGYQWVTQHLRMTVQGGLTVVDAPTDGPKSATEQDPEPKAIFGASISLRI
jgi:hypothetical protein